MPNRILRDWTDSERMDNLSCNEERFFTRLIMKVDDYGRYNANLKFLKSTLFPLKTDVRETDISRWLAACEKFGLIALYNVALKDYVQIENFKQVLRQKVEKFPAPPVKPACLSSASHLHSICIASASLNRIETEEEEETEREGEVPFFLIPSFLKIFYSENPNYSASESYDNPAAQKFAQFISEQKFSRKDYTNLPKLKQLEIVEELKKVSKWYTRMSSTKSLDTLAKWNIQQIITESKLSNTAKKMVI